MKKTKRTLCIILTMILLIGTVPVNITAKTVEEWEKIFYYTDEKSPYSIEVYQNQKNSTVKYKFIVYENNSVDKIEYVTQQYTLKNKEVNYDLNDEETQYEILLKAVEKDKYLGLSFTGRTPIISALKKKGITHLCYDCYEGTVTTKVGRKTVCSKCKGTNIDSINIIWQILAHWDLEDVHQECWTKNAGTYIFAQQMLNETWLNNNFAQKFQMTWEEALELYEEKDSVVSENDIKIINAVWETQQQVADYFNKTETSKLIEKYKALAKAKCIGAITDSLDGIAGAFISDEYFDVIEKIFSEKEQTEDILEVRKKIKEAKSKEELIEIFQDLSNETLDDLLKQIIEFLPMTSSIKEYLSTFGIDISLITDAIELGNLCNEIGDDFSKFYNNYYAILNGNNVKKKYIRRLYDDIVLATTLKNALD